MFALVLALATLGGEGTPAYAWTAVDALNTNAASDSGYDGGSQVTTDGLGHWVAVWESNENLGGTIGTDFDILVSRSTNNGATWTAVAALNTNAATDLGGDSAPQVTTDGAGHWVAVWKSNDSLGGTIGTDNDILVSRSTDNGATWTAPVALNTNAATDSGYDTGPQVTSDGGSNWVAVWYSDDTLGGTIGTDFDILVSRSTDNGATWTAPAALNTNAAADSGTDDSPQVTTDGLGRWVAVWRSDDSLGDTIGTDWDILVSRSINNGASWTAPAALNTNAATDTGWDHEPQVTTDGLGHWVAAWYSDDSLGGTIGTDDDIPVSRSTDNGATWTAPAPLNTNAATDAGHDGGPQVATDGLGGWVAVWESTDSLGGTIGTDGDILVSRSTNNGATWTAPAPLNTNAATDTGEDRYPQVTTDGQSRWAAAWRSNDSLGGTIGTDYDILYATAPYASAGTLLLTLDTPNPQAFAAFGESVAVVGDVNNDGKINDGCPPLGPVESGVQCQNSVDDDADTKINDGCPAVGPPETGAQCDNALDDEDDGKGDIAVGAPWEDVGGNNDQGRVYVLSGANGSPLFTLDMPPLNAEAGAEFGWSVAVVGDVNNDGKGDIAVGAYKEDVGANNDQGRVYVFSSGNGMLVRTLDMPNPQAGAKFGQSVAPAGDLNGDTYGDIAVGAPYEDVVVNQTPNADQGRAYVLSGYNGAVLWTIDMPALNAEAGANFGWSVAVTDVNANGVTDAVVGAPYEDVDYTDQGRAYVLSADAVLQRTLTSPNPQSYARFGYAVAVGDVNGDGKINDGCPAGPAEAGGQCDNALDDDGDTLINDGCPAVGPPETGVQCVNAVDDDVDGKINDGCPAIGPAEAGGQCNNALDDDGDTLINDGCPAVGPPETGAQCGNAVDDDGDGNKDTAVGADKEDVGGNVDQGRAYVFSGTDGSLLLTLDNPNTPQADALFGHSLALGDVNADRKADIAVGADEEAGAQGRAYVFAGPSGFPLLTLNTPNPQATAYFGHAVAVGEVKGDGKINDGCPAVGPPETGAQCDNALDDDADVKINDGCPAVGTPETGAQCNNALDDVGDGGEGIAVGAPGEDVGGNEGQGRAYVFSAGGVPPAGTEYYNVTFTGAISLDGSPVGTLVATGTAKVTRGNPYWSGGQQCADYHIESLTLRGTLGTTSVEIRVGEGLTVPVSSGTTCEGTEGFDVTLSLYVEEWDEGASLASGGFTLQTDDPKYCSCCTDCGMEEERWSSIECTAVVSEDPPDQITYDCGDGYDLCDCETDDERVRVDNPDTGGLLLTLVGGIAELPGATAGSDQSARSSSGWGFDYTALGGALAAAAVVVLAAGAWLARRRWGR
jgi:hypothetical protein